MVMLVVESTVSVASAVPFGVRTRLEGWVAVENPAGGEETVRLTVPENPFRLVRVTTEDADELD